MGLIRINRYPSRAQLAVFGVIWLVFFAAAGLLAFTQGATGAVATTLWIIAAAVPAAGWIAPRFMRVVYLGLAYVTFPVGFALSFLLLAAIYYLVLTPTGLLMRTFGYDPMNRTFDSGAESYWIARKADVNGDRYFRQF